MSTMASMAGGKLLWTAVMFAVVLGCVALAAATKSVIPVFSAWVPLLVAVWALTRPDPSDNLWPHPAPKEGERAKG